MYRSSLFYGWKPDLPDHRDLKYAAAAATLRKLPPKVDLRSHCPAVYDQGPLGSCTGNAIAGAIQFEMIRQKMSDWTPSRLFIYYNERVIENTVNSDSGAQIRDGIKTVNKQGVCPETMWPYVRNEFDKKPYDTCYTSALQNKAVSYQRVAQILTQMKGCLAEGFPFVAGFTAYSSFEGQEVAKTGVLGLPDKSEDVVGGHAVLVVGYNDSKKTWLVRNSWSANWGQAGYFTMPYAYLLNEDLASDFWTIRMIAAASAAPKPGSGGRVSKLGPHTLTLAAGAGSTANFTVKFLSGGAADTITLKLLRTDKTTQPNDTQSKDFKGGAIAFSNVKAEDVIIVSGVCLGSCNLTVDIPMKSGPPDSYPSGHIFDNLIA